MKKYIRASSGRASDIPDHLKPYYFIASKGEARAAGYDVDYIGDKETVDFYKQNGYTWDGFLLVKPEYEQYLDGELSCPDVVVDDHSGELLAVYIVHDRIYDITEDDIDRAIPEDMIDVESASKVCARSYRPSFTYPKIFAKYTVDQIQFVKDCYDEVCRDISEAYIHEDDPEYESYSPAGEGTIKNEYLAEAVETGLLTEEEFNELYAACEEEGTETAMAFA